MKQLLACFAVLTTIGTLLPSTALAQSRNFVTGDAGLYWSAEAGGTIPQDGHITEFGPWSSGQKLTYGAGVGLDLGFGYAFNRYFATELQLGGTWNEIDSVDGASLDDTVFGTMPILANLVLTYPIPETRIVPYIGGGAGGAATFFDTDGFYMRVPGGPVTLHGSESDFVFAWQGLAGVRVGLNDTMSLGVAYHFLYVDPSTFSFDSYHRGPTLDLGLSSYQAHVIALTFQMKF